MLLDELVTTADAVASTRSRLAKVDALADLLGRLEPDEIAPAVGFLVGKPRQGRVGYLLDPDGNVFGLISPVMSDGTRAM